jgi:hypothetical protein
MLSRTRSPPSPGAAAPPATTEIGRPSLAQRFRAAVDVILGQRDDDLPDAIARGEGRDAQLENRSPADVEELLGRSAPKRTPPAACGDNGGNLHVRNEGLLGGWS